VFSSGYFGDPTKYHLEDPGLKPNTGKAHTAVAFDSSLVVGLCGQANTAPILQGYLHNSVCAKPLS
jgi:hypothetical protein